MAKAKSTEAQFQDRVLRVEKTDPRALKKALSGRDAVAKALALLAGEIDPKKPPAWIVFTADGPLDDVAHLAAPAFFANGADEDEFFSEPGKTQIVFGKKGKCTRVDESGDTSDLALAEKDLKKITAYDVGGFLLANVTFIDDAPGDFASFEKLLKRAGAAYTGDMSPYEIASKTAPTKSAAAALPAAAPGSGGAFLGGDRRTGFVSASAPKKKPAVMWSARHEDNAGAEWGGNPVLADGVLFAGDSGFAAKLSATSTSGKSLWRTQLTQNQSWVIGSACVDRGVVYQLTNQGLFAVDAKTGKIKWNAKLSKPTGSPLVIGDKIFVASKDGVFGLSLENGRKQWKHPLKGKDGTQGALTLANGMLFFIAADELRAVDLESTEEKWHAPAYARATPSADDDTIYTWAPGGLVAYELATGKKRWQTKFESLNWSSTIAIASDRVVTRADGKLVAIAKATGKISWSLAGFPKPYDIGCASPVIAGDVALCVLVQDSYSNARALVAADLASGKELWRAGDFPNEDDKDQMSWYATPCVGTDGTIFVQADAGLYALR